MKISLSLGGGRPTPTFSCYKELLKSGAPSKVALNDYHLMSAPPLAPFLRSMLTMADLGFFFLTTGQTGGSEGLKAEAKKG